MVVLINYFQTTSEKYNNIRSVDDVKNYNFKNNKVKSKVNENSVEINFNDDNSYTVKCSCGKPNCIHIYKTLLYHDVELNREESKILVKTLDNVKRLPEQEFEKVNITDDANTYLTYLKNILNYNIDRNSNLNSENNIDVQLFIYNMQFIFLDIRKFIALERYNLAFESIKLLYGYFISMESVEYLFKPVSKDLNSLLNDLIKEAKEINKKIFQWIVEIMQIPAYNSFILDIYNISKKRYTKKEYLELKEELTLILYDRASKSKYQKYQELENDYWKINRERLIENFDEREYWYEYHLSILKRLKYSPEELEVFYYNTRDYYLGRRQLKWRYERTRQKKKLINIIKEEIEDPEITEFKRNEALREIKLYDEEYLESEEYLNAISKLLFEYKISNKRLLKDYINLAPYWEQDADKLIKNLEQTGDDDKLLNILYYGNYEKEKLLNSILESKNIKEFIKYEDFLMEDYPMELKNFIIQELKDPKYTYAKKINDYDKLLKHFKKYPNWREELESIRTYVKKNFIDNKEIIRKINSNLKMNYREETLDKYF